MGDMRCTPFQLSVQEAEVVVSTGVVRGETSLSTTLLYLFFVLVDDFTPQMAGEFEDGEENSLHAGQCRITGAQARQTRVEVRHRALAISISLFRHTHMEDGWILSSPTPWSRRSFGAAAVWRAICYSAGFRFHAQNWAAGCFCLLRIFNCGDS
ncbi:hypothetical protein MGYG_06526 [Nannizzia gypsea CBS 118893]|uniref:Uncharacterized protein n=1 Tax=Arthroderma gypseum (strain ATCC MYA-4604 / CBS 118893) TaxID=535722 RepID=E4UZJ9_ARTGP|nr:hypothetical protein MGYG_06526 [Nannizzia gypsea CBS 118893]EFR03529.1 hypothetical protein MGYG_06526 [Nannizzia gypsea CBS 118893]